MKHSVKFSVIKTSTTAQFTHKLSPTPFPLPNAPSPDHAAVSDYSLFHTISTSKTSQALFSIFFFMMGMVLMAKVFHHF